ncbi:MAG: hypothetical protein AB7F59_03725 [Bdellovibrionales bacterium]
MKCFMTLMAFVVSGSALASEDQSRFEQAKVGGSKFVTPLSSLICERKHESGGVLIELKKIAGQTFHYKKIVRSGVRVYGVYFPKVTLIEDVVECEQNKEDSAKVACRSPDRWTSVRTNDPETNAQQIHVSTGDRQEIRIVTFERRECSVK